MTWEETIKYIRTKKEYSDLVKFAYFEEDLQLNVERYRASEEFAEIIQLIETTISFNQSIRLLDIGSGNGITAVAFALKGIQVDSVEPDPSDTIGAGAIKKLKQQYQLSNLTIHEGFAEDLKFRDESFDIVFSRQCMHHAHHLQQFLNECHRVVKKGGLLLTVRDHVILDESDKKWFLETHPLQKFYGGENAYTAGEYKTAIIKAGFNLKKQFCHFENVINYFPLKKIDKEIKEKEYEKFIDSLIKRKLGVFKEIGFVNNMASTYVRKKVVPPHDENKVPGRMYTFLAIKEK